MYVKKSRIHKKARGKNSNFVKGPINKSQIAIKSRSKKRISSKGHEKKCNFNLKKAQILIKNIKEKMYFVEKLLKKHEFLKNTTE